MPDISAPHVFSEILIHATWHCKANMNLISPAIEPNLHQALANICDRTIGVTLLAVNGTQNHVHVAFQVTPAVEIGKFIGKLKGGSAYDINHGTGRKTLEWQRGYGVVSFSKRHAATIIDYIARQKEHHGGDGSGLVAALENCGREAGAGE